MDKDDKAQMGLFVEDDLCLFPIRHKNEYDIVYCNHWTVDWLSDLNYKQGQAICSMAMLRTITEYFCIFNRAQDVIKHSWIVPQDLDIRQKFVMVFRKKES